MQLFSNKSVQHGFGVTGVLAIVVVVALLGFGGWYVWQAQNKSSNHSAASKQTTQTDPNEGYVVIKEWGVRFKPVSGLDGLTYALRNSGDTAVFSTQQLTTIDARCDAQNSSYSGIGSVIRTITGSAGRFSGIPLTTVNGYDYHYQGAGQAVCVYDATDEAGQTLLQDSGRNFSESIKSLETVQ